MELGLIRAIFAQSPNPCQAPYAEGQGQAEKDETGDDGGRWWAGVGGIIAFRERGRVQWRSEESAVGSCRTASRQRGREEGWEFLRRRDCTFARDAVEEWHIGEDKSVIHNTDGRKGDEGRLEEEKSGRGHPFTASRQRAFLPSCQRGVYSDWRAAQALSQMRFVPKHELRDAVCRVQAKLAAQHVSSTPDSTRIS